jgi:hypothetical protein
MAREPEYIVGAPRCLILAEQFSYLLVHSRMCQVAGCSDCIQFGAIESRLMRHFYGEHEQLLNLCASSVAGLLLKVEPKALQVWLEHPLDGPVER